jgi:predicted Zn-dependent protease with MMP-like domain/Flp pilus assembly protein TadD
VRCQLSLTGPPRDAQTLLGLLLQRADERNRAGLALHKDAAPHGKPPGSGPAHAPDGKADGKPDAKSATTSSAESEASCRPGPDPDDPALPLFREALACTTLAMRFPSPSVPMLRQRGIAQRELGAVEDARDTFSRALATAPDDPALLADAADLYISHLSATREHSEIGLLYAERGQKQLQPNPSADAGRGGRSATRRLRDRTRGLSDGTRELLAQLHLLTGQALLDLGRASQALPALDAALRLRESPEARYERAVALFELCRFPEAQVAFEQLLAGNPSARRAAWSHYHLGLILEQLGQGAAAERELALAQKLMPDHFPAPLPIDAAEFARLVKQESDSLPKDSAADLKLVRLELADIPDPRDLTLESPPLSPTILGLYRGLPLGDEPSEPRSIVLYRKNLLRAVRSQKELVQEIEKTLLHELGHLHGADEDDLREEGLE